MIRKVDKKNRFISMFDSKTGFYIRSGIIDENGKDKNMRSLRNFMKLINAIVRRM